MTPTNPQRGSLNRSQNVSRYGTFRITATAVDAPVRPRYPSRNTRPTTGRAPPPSRAPARTRSRRWAARCLTSGSDLGKASTWGSGRAGAGGQVVGWRRAAGGDGTRGVVGRGDARCDDGLAVGRGCGEGGWAGAREQCAVAAVWEN
ncbi:uncharacterized protein PG998_002696 [Apiospora kogelbergensis]|uniref:uncharacterized protein n=1 Tax=Apiospora kogelbergensis TaxID=1337665 RepID=UPI00312F15B5